MRTPIREDSQETSHRGEDVPNVRESPQIYRCPPRNTPRQREPRPNGQARNDEANHDEERKDSRRPAEPDARYEVLEHDGKNDPAHCATAENDSDGRGASPAEPVAHNCYRRVEPAKHACQWRSA